MSSEEFTQDLDNFKMKAPNTGLLEQQQRKKEAEREALAKIFNSKREEAATSPSMHLVEDVKKVPNVPAPPSPVINAEHEPKSIAWRQTTLQQLVALYPAKHAISDLIMTINGALQQPNISYSLLGPTGTQFLIKSENGSLFLADPEKDGKAFANIGLNPDLDNDATDDKDAATRMKPLQGTTPISTIKHTEGTEFGIKESFEETLNERHIVKTEDIKDSKTREVVEKLRAMAADLRSGKRVNIDESTKVQIDVKTLNNALFMAQSLFNRDKISMYDAVADDLSSAIAECLLSNRSYVEADKLTKDTLEFIEKV
jgi:hypothetical protein